MIMMQHYGMSHRDAGELPLTALLVLMQNLAERIDTEGGGTSRVVERPIEHLVESLGLGTE